MGAPRLELRSFICAGSPAAWGASFDRRRARDSAALASAPVGDERSRLIVCVMPCANVFARGIAFFARLRLRQLSAQPKGARCRRSAQGRPYQPAYAALRLSPRRVSWLGLRRLFAPTPCGQRNTDDPSAQEEQGARLWHWPRRIGARRRRRRRGPRFLRFFDNRGGRRLQIGPNVRGDAFL